MQGDIDLGGAKLLTTMNVQTEQWNRRLTAALRASIFAMKRTRQPKFNCDIGGSIVVGSYSHLGPTQTSTDVN